ncbi:MAG: hypothetical protein V2I45_11085 [Halieaceae bacterium]|nr:hypothetical protein [Halieaceae bacterium]
MSLELNISELVEDWSIPDWDCQVAEYVNDWLMLPRSSRDEVKCRDYVAWRLEQQLLASITPRTRTATSPEVFIRDVEWDSRSKLYLDYTLARFRDGRYADIKREHVFLLCAHLARDTRLKSLDEYEAELAERILSSLA